MTHDLKSTPINFRALLAGRRWFDVRRYDDGRNFGVGEFVTLREHLPTQNRFTERTQTFKIVDRFDGDGHNGVMPGFCVLGLEPFGDAVQGGVRIEDAPEADGSPSRALAKSWPLGTRLRADVAEVTPVAQVLVDEHLERHTVTGPGRDTKAKAGDSGTMTFTADGKGGGIWKFTRDGAPSAD